MNLTRYTAMVGTASAEIEIQRSRFLCTLTHAQSDEAAKLIWAREKERHHDARHHCLAFVIGPDHSLRRSSDDGEPGGTAGPPMLDVLDGSGISDIVAVVTRWFGGILLGPGGLIRAYSDSVRAGLENVQTVERELVIEQRLTLSAAEAGSIEADLRRRGFLILDTQWSNEVTMTVGSPNDEADSLQPLLANLTSGRVTATRIGSRWADVS